jgi:hypothetical protein
MDLWSDSILGLGGTADNAGRLIRSRIGSITLELDANVEAEVPHAGFPLSTLFATNPRGQRNEAQNVKSGGARHAK